MSKGFIHPDTIRFLEDLRENNNRLWFKDNKTRFEAANREMKSFLAAVVQEMNKVDEIEASKLFRIYRDVRFSKDKTPYNYHFSMSMSRAKPHLRGGYYIRITPEASAIACGFWNPNPADLLLIRKNIEADDGPLRSAIGLPEIVNTFGALEGEKVKTAPKGFQRDHPAIDLLRHKQFILSKGYTDKEVTSNNFHGNVAESFNKVRPWFDYMSDILTHNLNGEPLY